MATTVQISSQDVASAASFLEQFLSDSVSDGDFSSGTALRDLTVQALAAVFAFMRADSTTVRQMQSLNTVQAALASASDPEALRDAVAAILSNVFITLKPGTKARGAAIGHASALTDIFIPVTVRFTYQPGTVFVVDSSETVFIPQNELIPIIDAGGTILEYQFRIPLVAVDTGDAYNVDPGLFSGFDRFNPFVTRIENTVKFTGGNGPETVSQVLDRAPTALSVRNLINQRSITAVLDDNFPEIRAIFVVRFGDPEMQRDKLTVAPPFMQIHIGGCVDIYVLLDMVETSFTGVVGDFFERPDEIVSIFRDPNVNFAPVQVGDVINITAGIPNTPRQFLVTANNGTELEIDEHVPFPLATDEINPPGEVSYTIGRSAPGFNDVLAGIGLQPITTGTTSRRTTMSGRITLPGGPVMDILDVAIINPANSEAAFVSPVDGFEHFPNHVNGTPSNVATPTQGLQFETIVHNAQQAQSALQWMEIVVGTDANQARFDGKNLRVRYRTLAGFDSIDTFVRATDERTVAASQLPRGHHPVSLAMAINYKLSPTAASVLDDSVLAQSIVDFVNTFDTSAVPIDVSAISDLLRNNNPSISAILPITITYTLRAPTGQILTYQTTDLVSVAAAKQTAGPVLDLAGLGVSDRTLRYIANTIDVTTKQVV